MALSQPLKWHGGKHYLAKRIVELMPPHTHYVEPYAGGLSVLLAKDPIDISECVNDIDGDLVNFWWVLKDVDQFSQFQRMVQAVPFSEQDWEDAAVVLDDPDPVTRAVAFFVRCRQSLAGRMDTFAPLSRTRTRRGMNEQAAAWLTAVEGLPAVHSRLKRVAILCRPALEVIEGQDGLSTLFYCDPPYMPCTRASNGTFKHEMAPEDHKALLAVLCSVKGKVMLSGYSSVLYDTMLRGWTRHTWDLPNNAAGGRVKARMQEVLWCNW